MKSLKHYARIRPMLNRDYHVHSNFSPDGKDEAEEIIIEAINKGLSEIVFTEHYELAPKGGPTRSFSDPEYIKRFAEGILKLKEKYKERIFIGLGIEIGQAHYAYCYIESILSDYPFDFVLASYHKVEGLDLSQYDYEKVDSKALLNKYLDGLYEIAKYADYDSLAHLDLINRYSKRAGYPVSIIEEEEKVEKILKTVIARDKAIEINTSSIKDGMGETLPSEPVFSSYSALGGKKITVGSDAHTKNNLAKGFERAEDLICRYGFSFPSYRARKIID